MKEPGLFVGYFYGNTSRFIYPTSAQLKKDSRFTYVKVIAGRMYIYAYNPSKNSSVNNSPNAN